MTPPPAASHAANRSIEFGPSRASADALATVITRVLEPGIWSRLRLVIDAVVIYLAASAAVFAAPGHDGAGNRWLAAAFPLIVLALLHTRPSPDDRFFASIVDLGSHILGAVSLGAMVTIALDSFIGASHPIALALRLWVFGFVYLGTARIALMSIRRHAATTPALATPTLVVGAGAVGRHLVKRLFAERRYGMRPVGFIDSDPLPRPANSASPSVPVVGGPEDLVAAVERTGARRLILAFSSAPDQQLVERVRECEAIGVEVSLVPRLYESISQRATLDHVGGIPLVSLNTVNPRGWQFGVKHAMDRGVAAVAIVAIAPLLGAIALAVRLTSPGPVFFRQRRVGRDGREFDLLKFRTMREGSGPADFQLPDGCAPGGVEGDDRRTRIGKVLRDLSLDELPQFINVLRGDMSIVGPRPERPDYVRRFSAEIDRYADRHRVKSGITGWAQVNGLRGQTSIADRIEWDNHYIQNWSLRFDLRIMALTVAAVFKNSE
jgi:exopolysaccharide biosynthesis polyprenyl glycosylphosphotransferase